MNTKKKPTFVRQDIHKRKCLKFAWRKPSGIDSKMRLGLKGHRKTPSPGYGSKREERGLLKGNLRGVLISSLQDLKGIDAKKSGAILSSTVGKRKKAEIVRECLSKNIKIINMRDANAFLRSIEEMKEKKKEAKGKREEKKEEKKGVEKVLTDEEKKLEVKKEMDKMLIRKDAL
ncbi:MAG TPA: eL32 family ribosomal protein [Candidatus Nanoarchaeia archaeon]|nr:eL32 family ribosomal protein [Candidatus Nanoarchaeia archaeon]